MVLADYNILTPQQIDELITPPIHQAIGKREVRRIQQQLQNYAYYNGYQHINPETGQLVKAKDLPRPAGLDYDPTRYATNYFKAFIRRKARWQMGGKHGISVPPKQIDDVTESVKPDYEPSLAQQAENDRAENYERLLYQLWDENKMREKLLQAARDRLIAGRVGCKILFNPNTGKLRWVFRPDTEIIPVYSDDDYEELTAVYFITNKTYTDKYDAEVDLLHVQSFRMLEGECWLHEALYTQDLELVETITKEQPMGIDFLPVVLFEIRELSGEQTPENSEIDDMKEQTDVLNRMNEDAIDSLKFEMFPITAFMNVSEGTAEKAQLAPGAAIEARAANEGEQPSIHKVESGFRWKEAFKDQYARVKGALHEITSLPQVVPQDLNFGGLNADALHILFHEIIQETEEHWLAWEPALAELHEKSIRYLQKRADAISFAYDRDVVKQIGDDYHSEIKFVLPLPDNRRELVDLLMAETDAGFESIAGAMNRLGVENTNAKKQEIANERTEFRQAGDPYGRYHNEGGGVDSVVLENEEGLRD